jgi:hypothetical protein
MSPEAARKRFQTAVQGLVAMYGQHRLVYGLGKLSGRSHTEKTIRNWAKGLTVPDYGIGVVLVDWYDREINSPPSSAKINRHA